MQGAQQRSPRRGGVFARHKLAGETPAQQCHNASIANKRMAQMRRISIDAAIMSSCVSNA
jgi:mannose-1-phosphate guanylyltransferase